MLPYLELTAKFPDVRDALVEPNGLLAAGADLSPQRLINAYSNGIFPWFSDDEPILWWSPNPRIIFQTHDFQPSKSLIRYLKKTDLTVTLNHAFQSVVEECAAPRKDQLGTWITQDIKQAYCELHRIGFAHSVEVWDKDILVGGVYGVAIGKLFCGESMFSRITNGSKVALSALIGFLRNNEFPILDCQVNNQHLVSLGAIEISREHYIRKVNALVELTNKQEIWAQKTLDHIQLVVRTAKTQSKSGSKNGV